VHGPTPACAFPGLRRLRVALLVTFHVDAFGSSEGWTPNLTVSTPLYMHYEVSVP